VRKSLGNYKSISRNCDGSRFVYLQWEENSVGKTEGNTIQLSKVTRVGKDTWFGDQGSFLDSHRKQRYHTKILDRSAEWHCGR
jgi:hypothetical protein